MFKARRQAGTSGCHHPQRRAELLADLALLEQLASPMQHRRTTSLAGSGDRKNAPPGSCVAAGARRGKTPSAGPIRYRTPRRQDRRRSVRARTSR